MKNWLDRPLIPLHRVVQHSPNIDVKINVKIQKTVANTSR
jgi:hypothetical protein